MNHNKFKPSNRLSDLKINPKDRTPSTLEETVKKISDLLSFVRTLKIEQLKDQYPSADAQTLKNKLQELLGPNRSGLEDDPNYREISASAFLKKISEHSS